MSRSKQDRAKLVLLDAMTATMARALIPHTLLTLVKVASVLPAPSKC